MHLILNGSNRYYYAIITCDTVDAAKHIYSELEGAELERSANIFDLSFVPEDMTFDDVCRYIPLWSSMFITEVLQRRGNC